MIDEFSAISRSCRLDVPAAWNRPIAIVGAGAIVEAAHLPAYKHAGLDVRGVFDLDTERAEHVASSFGIRAYGSLDAIRQDDVDVVDIAVVPSAQPDIAIEMMSEGKHVLCQKPLAIDSTIADSVADHADSADVNAVVNQQLRYDEGLLGARSMLRAGWIGDPLAITMNVNVHTDWSSWPWMARHDRLDLIFHTIHYLDAVRGLLGDPNLVWGVGKHKPGQLPVGETRTVSALVYDNGPLALLHTFHENTTGDNSATFRIDGTEGAIRGTLGLLYDYPHGRPDTLEVNSHVIPTDGWLAYPVTTRWLPHAFIGPMRSLLGAIVDEECPETSARDNVQTLRLIEALYRAHDTGESERLANASTATEPQTRR